METPRVRKEPSTYPYQLSLHPYKLSKSDLARSKWAGSHPDIDFILTPQRFRSSINKAKIRSFPGADMGSDHDVVLTTIKLKLKTKCFTKSPRIYFDLEKLKDTKITEVFQAKMGESWQPSPSLSTM